MENNRNYIVAIVLSVLILFGWQYFYMGPRMEAQRQADLAKQTAQDVATQQPANSAAAPGAAPGGGVPPAGAAGGAVSRDAAIGATGRVAIDTPDLSGSINLRGARFDDLKLKNYRETVAKDSPIITLLNPAETADGYFVELGYVGGNSLPGPATEWKADGNAKLTPATPVTLTYTSPEGLTFARTISVDKNYMFTIADKVTNGGQQAANISGYGRVTRYREPETPSTYVLHEGFIGWLGANGLSEEKYKAAKDKPLNYDQTTGGWLGMTDKYWATTIIPPQDISYDARFTHFEDGTPRFQADFKSAGISIAPGETKELKNLVFAGAKEVPVVDGYAKDDSWFGKLTNGVIGSKTVEKGYDVPRFDLLIDWGWFYFFTKPMFALMDFFFRYFGNFGLAILATTIVIKALFFPLASKQYASMANMKKIQPKMEELKAKHGDDRVALQQATMQLYKEEKINPVAGCWPVLLQIPVFFSLYKVIYITIEMRHAPFFGWIRDLSAPDPTSFVNLFGLLPFDAPAVVHLGVWPIIMGITMFLQMRMNPTPPDPAQAMIFTWMPVVFTFMLGSFPAGLVIYWAWNNTLSIIQQSIIMKRHGVKIELFNNLKGLFKKQTKA
jgi:YidC/Oxa1 family membrane protein insertase